MKNEAITVQTKVEHTTILQETIQGLLECKTEDKNRKYLTREKRKKILLKYADFLHENGCPEVMVCAKVCQTLKKFISVTYITTLLPDKYKNPKLQHSDATKIKRSIKRIGAMVSESESEALKNHNVVIIPKQKVQLIMESSLRCKNNVVLILGKTNRRPIAIYPDVNSQDYPIRIEELLESEQ